MLSRDPQKLLELTGVATNLNITFPSREAPLIKGFGYLCTAMHPALLSPLEAGMQAWFSFGKKECWREATDEVSYNFTSCITAFND